MTTPAPAPATDLPPSAPLPVDALPLADADPDIGGDGLEPADPRYVAVLRANLLVPTIALVAAGIGVAAALRAADLSVWSAPPILATLGAAWLIGVWPRRRVAAMGHRLDARALRAVRGAQFRVDTVVPLRRVQHLDVAQGPVERSRGLARLVVHTAGDSDSTVTVAGLPRERADAMRDAIRAAILAERGGDGPVDPETLPA